MEEIDLKELIGIFWKKKFLIILVVILFAIIGLAYSMFSYSETFTATTTLIITPELESYSDYYHITNDNEIIDVEKTYNDANRLSNELTINTRLLSSSSVIVTSEVVANKVIDNLKLDLNADQLISSVTVTPATDAHTLDISVANSNSESSINIANEFAKVFIEKATEIYGRDNFKVLDKATVATASSASHLKNIVIFAFVGAVLVCGYILVVFMFDTSVKKSEDVEKQLGIKTVGTIFFSNKSKNKFVEDDSEMFRTLRTNLQFMNETENKKVMLITSSEKEEGKTYVSANLAMSFAKLNKKVLIIDADMNSGIQHTLFELDSKPGLSEILSENKNNILDLVQETKVNNLYVITKGELDKAPADLLVSEKIQDMLEVLKESFDVIIIDSPNCLNSSEALILSKVVDYTLLVVAQNITKFENLEKAKLAIENVNEKVTGIVLNKIPCQTKKICCCSCLKK